MQQKARHKKLMEQVWDFDIYYTAKLIYNPKLKPQIPSNIKKQWETETLKYNLYSQHWHRLRLWGGGSYQVLYRHFRIWLGAQGVS